MRHSRDETRDRHLVWVPAAVVMLATAFQFQTTLAIGATPVRVGVADLLSPFLAIAVLISMLRGGAQWPTWRLRYLWLWLIGLTAVLAVALIIGRLHTGEWTQWAVFNKFAGWFVLLWYFLLGGWFATQRNQQAPERFIGAFVLSSAFISLYSIFDFTAWASWAIDLPAGTGPYRLIGFMDNPNAFGITIAAAIALQAPYATARKGAGPRAHGVVATILFTALLLSWSRSAWIGLGCALALMFAYRSVTVRTLALPAIAATVIAVTLSYGLPTIVEEARMLFGFQPLGKLHTSAFWALLGERSVAGDAVSVESRLDMSVRALEMWWQKPVFGIGLGSYFWSEFDRSADVPYVIHNTFLWLLTETGLVGALAFAAFFLFCLRCLLQGVWSKAAGDPLLYPSLIGACAVFAGASVTTETMYQRHLWFFLGIALAMPTFRPKVDRQERS